MRLWSCVAALVIATTVASADEREIDIPSVGIPQLAVFPAPSRDQPIPPPIVAAPLPSFGGWRVQKIRPRLLTAGLVVGGAAYTITAAFGIAAHDWGLLVPGGGPMIGLLYPTSDTRTLGVAGEIAPLLFMAGMIDLFLQSGAPVLVVIGAWPKKVWQPK